MINWIDSKSDLTAAVEDSESIADVLRILRLQPLGSNYKTFKKYADLFKIDTSHFMGKAHLSGKKRPNLPRKPLLDCLTRNSSFSSKQLKDRLLKEGLLENQCAGESCGISTWKKKPLVLHLDHINGVNNDHRLENLRLLCPNCHSQTKTYCGRNRNHEFAKRILDNKCLDCQASIHAYAKRCRSCAAKFSNPTKTNWVPTQELRVLVDAIGYSAVGRQLGVSGNAVKKRIRNYLND